ncbi:hypothetical protein LPW26_17025 [Rhodopseudomonas sp. HC1]|uniref:hypothetical protein n=1 Tax=Rhodopseudomonas infernalis TaxID=2897386 RepID=UPI001EE83949|nr:hypothetical protein [Rhodopseudomonas infernalis]MCG6206354.1 hypothetical protein [Rhodopseudomonas infernalis]
MKKIALGMAAAVVLGLGAFSGAASAAPAASATTSVAQPMTDFSAQRRMHRHHGMHRRPHCTVRKVVTRGPYGKRIVRTSRVCR